MKNPFLRKVTGRSLLLLFLVTTTIYVFMLVVTIPRLMDFSGGIKVPDMMPGGYDLPYMINLLEALSEEGRWFYLSRQLPLDFLYPGLFAITYSLIVIYFLRKINKETAAWRWIAFLPLVAGVADYIENIFFIYFIKSFPGITEGQVRVASVVSVLKASATTAYFILLCILVIMVLITRIRNQRLRSFR